MSSVCMVLGYGTHVSAWWMSNVKKINGRLENAFFLDVSRATVHSCVPVLEASAGTGSVHAHHRRGGDCARDEGEMLPCGFKL